MSMFSTTTVGAQVPDRLLVDIARYVCGIEIHSELAYESARLALLDSIGCAFEALDYPACTKLLGPIVPGTVVPNGARVPGTGDRLDPVLAAFNFGAMIRWLDFNDTWLAAEWGHPSDNFGGILMVADWLSRTAAAEGRAPLTLRDVLTAGIKAYEIQGCLALENAFNRVGLDHVVLVKVASAAVITRMLGGNEEQVADVVSQAWVDGQALRTYRHAPNTGSRKSWAAGDATSRAVRLSLITMSGEMGYPTVLSAKQWGFYDSLFRGEPFKMSRAFDSYVIEHVLFKIRFPAEFHAQTAVEAAVILHPHVMPRLDDVERIVLTTHESALRIIDKQGPLNNPADRDHCIQYMTAVAMLKGDLVAADYEDVAAADPRIDRLRERMVCVEDRTFSADYLDPQKRSIANAVQVFFTDGSSTDNILIDYPIGHPRRRAEGVPLLYAKAERNLLRRLTEAGVRTIVDLFRDPARLDAVPVSDFVDRLVPESIR
jgi:2-methylcitrate dehydratase